VVGGLGQASLEFRQPTLLDDTIVIREDQKPPERASRPAIAGRARAAIRPPHQSDPKSIGEPRHDGRRRDGAPVVGHHYLELFRRELDPCQCVEARRESLGAVAGRDNNGEQWYRVHIGAGGLGG
jgi:hypothetical protein